MRDAGTGPVSSAVAPTWMTIPGDPAAVMGLAGQLTAAAELFADGARALGRVEVEWSGAAAGAFAAEFELYPVRWKQAAPAFADAGAALHGYADTLRAAQAAASGAASLYARGLEQQAATDPVGVLLAGHPGPPADALSTGSPLCQQAMVQFSRACQAVRDGGDDASRSVATAVQAAPDAPGWYESVAHAGSVSGVWLWDHLVGPVLAPTVNALADVGAAAAHHPEDIAQVAGGAGLVWLGGAGLGGSGLLDASIVGAPAGVVVGVASLGLVGAGGTLAAQGASRWGQHALDERSDVMQAKWKETERNGHAAGFKVTGADGIVRGGGGVTSRPMDDWEKRLPFPDSVKAAHTEARITRLWNDRFRPGDTVEIWGTEDPCGSCRSAMKEAAEDVEITIVYRANGEAWTWG